MVSWAFLKTWKTEAVAQPRLAFIRDPGSAREVEENCGKGEVPYKQIRPSGCKTESWGSQLQVGPGVLDAAKYAGQG